MRVQYDPRSVSRNSTEKFSLLNFQLNLTVDLFSNFKLITMFESTSEIRNVHVDADILKGRMNRCAESCYKESFNELLDKEREQSDSLTMNIPSSIPSTSGILYTMHIEFVFAHLSEQNSVQDL